MIIRALREDDLEAVARIHAEAFPAGALTQFGQEALRRYYAWQLRGPHEYETVGVFDGDSLVAFCFGGISRGAVSGFIQGNRWFLMRRLLLRPVLLLNPTVRARMRSGLRLMRSLWRSTGRLATTRPRNEVISFGILSVAVEPGSQGRGIGRLLMNAAEDAARRGGFESMHLTVSPDNQRAIRFYERLNWEKAVEGCNWNGRMKKVLDIPTVR